MPTELQGMVLEELDVGTIRNLAQASPDLRKLAQTHPPTRGRVLADHFMRTFTLPPAQSTLDELRVIAPHLTEEHVRSLTEKALTEYNGGFTCACLLGPLLSGRTEREAEQVAQALDKTSTRFTGNSSQEEADRRARGGLLMQVLGEIGETKHSQVYKPFVVRLASHSEYTLSIHAVVGLKRKFLKFPKIPATAKEDICKSLLIREDDNKKLLAFAFQMFLLLEDFSPDIQDFVFERTRAFFQVRGPLTDENEEENLRDMYSADNIAEIFPDQPEQRKKWNELIDAACPRARTKEVSETDSDSSF